MSKFVYSPLRRTGFAHLAVLIVIVVFAVVVGGGVYIATKSKTGINAELSVTSKKTIVDCNNEYSSGVGDYDSLFSCYAQVAHENSDYSACEKIDKDKNPLVARAEPHDLIVERAQINCLAGVGVVDAAAPECAKTLSSKQTDFCLAVKAVRTRDLNSCSDIALPFYKDLCYKGLAQANKDESLCSKIVDESEIPGCYTDVAIAKKDKSVCAINKDAEEKNNCLKNIAPILKDPQICADILRQDHYLSEIYAGDCFGDVAIATNNPQLCDKARFAESCVLDVALKNKNQSACRFIKDGDKSKQCTLILGTTKGDSSVCADKSGPEKEECMFAIGLSNKNSSFCEKSSEPDSCYSGFSVMNHDIAACDKVKSWIYSDECYEQLAYDRMDLAFCDKLKDRNNNAKEKCYLAMSRITGNESICDQLSNMPFGNNFKDSCYQHVAEFKKDSSYCSKIGIADYRDSCFSAVAYRLAEPSLCSSVADETNRSKCVDDISKTYFGGKPLKVEFSSQNVVSSTGNIYRNAKYGFELTLPPSWILTKDDTEEWDGTLSSMFSSPIMPDEPIEVSGPTISFWSDYSKTNRKEISISAGFLLRGALCADEEAKILKNSGYSGVANTVSTGTINGLKYIKFIQEGANGKGSGSYALEATPNIRFSIIGTDANDSSIFAKSKEFKDIVSSFKWVKKNFGEPSVIKSGKITLVEIKLEEAVGTIQGFYLPKCFKFSKTEAKVEKGLKEYFLLRGYAFGTENISIEVRDKNAAFNQQWDTYYRTILNKYYIGTVSLKNGTWQKAHLEEGNTIYETISGVNRVTVIHQPGDNSILSGAAVIDELVGLIKLFVPGVAEPR